MNLIPFEALQVGGHSLTAQYTVSYLQSGRELARVNAASDGLTEPVIAISPGGKMAGAALDGRFRSESLERLPGALNESRQLHMMLPRARILGEGEATEEALKKISRPALLHLIGHGVVRGKDLCSPCELDSLPPAERIMSLSAIVLEEAYGRGGESKQDGLLTAQELRGLDLEGTTMMVISQCRLADGVPATGDGVYGMRRAVTLAGVRSLVAPLWKVADTSEQILMAAFYFELKRGSDRAEALRKAKLELAARPGKAHFLNWAAPMLFGDVEKLPPALFHGTAP
jgi:CHAT domain-containing protein